MIEAGSKGSQQKYASVSWGGGAGGVRHLRDKGHFRGLSALGLDVGKGCLQERGWSRDGLGRCWCLGRVANFRD